MAQFNIYSFTHSFEDFELLDRQATKYTEIEEFGDHELSNNVAYELGSRNQDVQNELIKFITHDKEHSNAIIEYRQSITDKEFHFENFDYTKFFNYGFNEFSIWYLWFRKEAKNHNDTKDFSHNELCKFCKSYTDSLDYKFKDSPYETLLENYMMIDKYFNDDIFQKISCNLIKINNEIYNINLFDGTYYDVDSDNPYNLTESSKDNYLFKKGLYIYKDDIFDRELLPLSHKSYDEIMPTISLNYNRPIIKNPYMNKHIYAQINFNLEEDEILSNIKRMIEINNSQNDISLKQKILDASDLFFEKYKSYKKPKKIRKNDLNIYYANMLYAYDTMVLFNDYITKVDEKFEKGLEEIKSEKNLLETNGKIRKEQRQELKEWKREKKKKKTIHDEIYIILFDEEYAPIGSHEVNTLLGLAKELIEDKQYRFLI